MTNAVKNLGAFVILIALMVFIPIVEVIAKAGRSETLKWLIAVILLGVLYYISLGAAGTHPHQ